MAKIGPVDIEIIGLTEIVKNSSTTCYRMVGMIQELIMVREGNMSLSDVFSARDISILIDFV